VAHLASFNDLACTDASGGTAQVDAGCDEGATASGNVKFINATATGEACGLNNPTPKPPHFDAMVSCDVPSETQGCLPRPGAPFEPRVCVFQSGTVESCPAEFPVRFDVMESFTDARSCNDDCVCDASGVACNGSVSVHDDETCSAADETIPIGDCADVDATNGSVQYQPQPSGDCVQMQGTASGDTTPNSPETICCTAT
jgi:hypothetical protein